MEGSALVRGRRLPDARAVAEAGYAAMKRGTPYVVTGAASRAFAFGTRFLPAHGGGPDRGPLAATRRSRRAEDERWRTMIKEFKDFALKGNLIEIAVGLMLALAFFAVVTSFVDDIISPIIAAIFGKPTSAPSRSTSATPRSGTGRSSRR